MRLPNSEIFFPDTKPVFLDKEIRFRSRWAVPRSNKGIRKFGRRLGAHVGSKLEVFEGEFAPLGPNLRAFHAVSVLSPPL
jgi:hypothetical protein